MKSITYVTFVSNSGDQREKEYGLTPWEVLVEGLACYHDYQENLPKELKVGQMENTRPHAPLPRNVRTAAADRAKSEAWRMCQIEKL